ncbi:hypothetical protein G3M48_000492 [Beauveria asiatica]|uniref:Transposase IS30-like HTH domain-containing protein n=1 Tax=Beauveria asiatica TaxID=1069075 RepID=A0AAW0S8Z2_9HYPO
MSNDTKAQYPSTMSTSSSASHCLPSKMRARRPRALKLTEDKRTEIYTYALQSPKLSYRAIADKFQISSSTVGRVIRRKKTPRPTTPVAEYVPICPDYLELQPAPGFGQQPTFAEAGHCICHLIPLDILEKFTAYGNTYVSNGAGGDGSEGAISLPENAQSMPSPTQ